MPIQLFTHTSSLLVFHYYSLHFPLQLFGHSLLCVCLLFARWHTDLHKQVCEHAVCTFLCVLVYSGVCFSVADKRQGRAGRWFRKGVPVWTGALCPPHRCHHTSCLPADWNTGQRSNILEIMYLYCLLKLLWRIQNFFSIPTPHIIHFIFSLISNIL